MSPNAFFRRLQLILISMLLITSVSAQEQASVEGPTSLTETYDAWTVQCANQVEGETTRRFCQMSQELLQQETRQRVLLFAISKGADTAPKATLVLPFGLLLSDGIRVVLEEVDVVRGAFLTCLPSGCVVEVELPDDVMGQLESAEMVGVLMTASNGQPVRTDVSLRGFMAAYRRLLDLSAS